MLPPQIAGGYRPGVQILPVKVLDPGNLRFLLINLNLRVDYPNA